MPYSLTVRRRPAILLLAASALALTLSPLANRPAAAQDAARMDQVIRASSDADAFSGAVLVARDGRILLDQGYGLANREWNIPNDGDVKFRLGSLSKQFTAVAVMLLNQQGKLDLDAPIKTWLPDAPAAWDAITPRHLLSHTAGVPNFTAFSDFEAQKTRPATMSQLIARFRNRPLDFAPGSRFAYSNSGYVLLSAIIETASGQTYADFVAANLFQPLGMSDSGYDRHDMILPRRASGYALGADGVVNADYVDMSIPTGAGALYSTTHDLLKWEQGLFGGRLLNAQSMTALTTPVRNGYAMGLMVSEADGKRLVWHNGAIEGFNTYMAYDPGDRTAVIVLGNLNGEAPDKLGAALVTLARGGTVTLPSERRAVALSPEVLKAYGGVYNLAPTFALTISVVDGKLMAQATGQPAFELTAEAEDAFYLTAVDAQITFTRNADGAVEGLVLHQGGRDMPAKRQ
ncbi:serine hydrolase [Brevundimonas vesicularis]|uniref:serine hydrolase n=1 Tax=Brevundimonas vesicularis TaxID=41276 RepID=UPI0022EC1F1B|nr:serine hydrolase [Brevundimonas vesicularis]WBT07071.1 serine hydrolase [Brevundimonas vesicularis]